MPDGDSIGHRMWGDLILAQGNSWNRRNAYAGLLDHMTDEEMARAFRTTWINTEGGFSSEQIFLAFRKFDDRHNPRHWFMASHEMTRHAGFSAVITIFRGCRLETEDGISWSVSQDVARRFAFTAADEDANGVGLVIRGVCQRDRVRFYFDDTDLHEEEIVVDPRFVLERTQVESVTGDEESGSHTSPGEEENS